MLSLRPVANGKEGNKLGVTQLSKQGVANTLCSPPYTRGSREWNVTQKGLENMASEGSGKASLEHISTRP
jgi:hypothetical protein